MDNPGAQVELNLIENKKPDVSIDMKLLENDNDGSSNSKSPENPPQGLSIFINDQSANGGHTNTFNSPLSELKSSKIRRPSSSAANWMHVNSAVDHDEKQNLISPVARSRTSSLRGTAIQGIHSDHSSQADKRPNLEKLHIKISKNNTFEDQFGRSLWLRGVNMCAKIPHGLTMKSDKVGSALFYEHRKASFINEPISLASSDEHFARLKIWGLTFIRLGIPWEALEHEGPGIYDEEYIEFVINLIQKAGEHGFRVIIDPHQDVWSRFSGGSGAPGWTFEVAGLDIQKFRSTGAAHVHSWENNSTVEQMIWPTNLTKLACQTMFTLFFGGNVFASKTKYNNETVQDFLQRHYINCYRYLASRLAFLEPVIAFEAMNEPSQGYIGLESFTKYNYDKILHLSLAPNAIQSMALGSGIPQYVDVYERSFPFPTRKTGKQLVNSERECVWLSNNCIWREHGVWDYTYQNGNFEVKVLQPDYFKKNPNTRQSVEFYKDFYLPFLKTYFGAIRDAFGGRGKIFFLLEPLPNEPCPKLSSGFECTELGVGEELVFAPHWYDLSLLFSKKFNRVISHDVQALSNGSRNFFANTYFGTKGMRNNYYKQVMNIVDTSYHNLNKPLLSAGMPKNVPVIFGECGIPMDMNDHIGYSESDYRYHNLALDAMFRAMENSGISGFTLWNYYPKNEVLVGDHWNGEDFSIFSKSIADKLLGDEAREPLKEDEPFSEVVDFSKWYVGGRALEALIRPYAAKVAGRVEHSSFDFRNGNFVLQFSTEPVLDDISEKTTIYTQTEIFVPAFQYYNKAKPEDPYADLDVQISDGKTSFDPACQTLYYWHNVKETKHRLIIQKKAEGVKLIKLDRLIIPGRRSNSFLEKNSSRIITTVVLLLILIIVISLTAPLSSK